MKARTRMRVAASYWLHAAEQGRYAGLLGLPALLLLSGGPAGGLMREGLLPKGQDCSLFSSIHGGYRTPFQVRGDLGLESVSGDSLKGHWSISSGGETVRGRLARDDVSRSAERPG